jgi:glycosyltransferase involved in cell wall biosynthesis
MIKIAFLLNFTKEYKGGINYIKNLLYACSVNKHDDIQFFLFLPSDIEQEYVDAFSPYAQIVKTNILKRNTIPWFVEKVFEKKFKKNALLSNLLKKHKIDIVSHSNFFSRYKNLKIINWIPDFQILHYPDLWSAAERKRILGQYKDIVAYSDRIVLSSNDAFKDYLSFTSDNVDMVRVLQFVSQPAKISEAELINAKKAVEEKYKIDRDFLYLPNQFWSHKNHITVFKAINVLKKRGLNPLLVTTGQMADYRSNNTLKDILAYVDTNGLSENILLLGLIPYNEVLVLIRTCVALINPSLFEGWSSTVEEAKSSGKQILLSDIPIHREQNPENSIYFNPLDELNLANIIEKVLVAGKDNEANKFIIKQEVKDDLVQRTKLFSQKYHQIIAELIQH